MRSIFFLLFLLNGSNAFAQSKDGKEINQTDAQGKPNGLWYTSKPAMRGEPSEAIFGSYDHGQKMGLWYVSDGIGNLVSIETFKLGVRDGEAKYFENGHLTCIGHFRGLNPKVALDTVLVVDPITADEKLVSVPTERGSVRHGSWRFYDELSGRLVREEYYQIDELLYSKDFSISSTDSSHYQMRNQHLPHLDKNYKAPSRFKQKPATKTLIGN
jgi:antitoxin component YwqK of YwqJK toxin-antitoxin module